MTTDVTTPGSLDDRRRGEVFTYVGFDLDPERNRVVCHYRLDDRDFREEVTFPGGGDWAHPAVAEAARLLFLLAGVSYYKAGAPPVIDLGTTAVTAAERAFLRELLPRRSRRVRLPQRPRPHRTCGSTGPTLDRAGAGRLRPPRRAAR